MDVTSVIFQEFAKYKTEIIKFQEQHRLILGDESEVCNIILHNVKHFVDLLVNKISEEHENQNRN